MKTEDWITRPVSRWLTGIRMLVVLEKTIEHAARPFELDAVIEVRESFKQKAAFAMIALALRAFETAAILTITKPAQNQGMHEGSNR